MSVTSTTLAGTNVWRLSGSVTDAELKTAWSGLITNNRYLLGRTLYIDDTCSLVNVRGTYYIDSQNLGVILHLSRNKANTVFRNWFFTQTVGLSVGSRSNFVRFTNGSTITNSTTDGIDMVGGGMMYAVIGNPGGGDPRFLNEMMFGSLDGTLVTSAAWTEQEIEPTSIGTIWRGLNMQKAAGYPILSNSSGTQRHVIYRSNFNTENPTLRLIRPYYNNSLCYVSSTVRRQGGFVGPNLLDTFGSNGGCVIMALNNWRDESWFGVSRTNFGGANWNAGNRIIGGVMKKVLVQPNTLIRTYDSRSTTVSQKSTFSEVTQDFLSGTDSTTSDSVTGRAQFVCVGAIATGGSIAITRYTGQRFTLQKFGFRVQVETPDMTFGDDDLSAFSPITMTPQNGLVRDLATINSSTSIESYRELLEELHALSLTLVGSASYNAPFGGNLFELSGNTLNTGFSSVLVDKNASQKISYNPTTNALVIKSTSLSSSASVTQWSNPTGAISTANDATITGVYADVNGQRVRVFGLDPEGFGITWYLRHKLKSSSTWTNLSGTGNQTLVVLTSGEYDFQVRAPGYDWRESEIDTSVSLSLDMALRYQVSANNTPQYTMPFDSVLEAIFQYDSVEMKVSVANETGSIIQPGFAELYQATQRIQHISGLVWSWTAPVTANSTSQKILIPNGNPISMYLTDDSDASVKITCPVIHADTAESADDRVRGNSAGYSIILGSPATAESAGLASQIVGSLGGSGYTEALASQMRLKELIDDLQSLVQEVKSKTDVIPDDPATSSEVQNIKDKVDTLENTDISSLATSEQVLALGTPLQEADYVEPDNTSISEIKTKVLTLENAPSADTIADSVWNEVLTGNTHNINRSAGKRLRTLADTVILIEGVATDMSNPGDGTGLVTLTDATTVCIKQALRIGDQVRYVREFDPVTKVARLDRPWCTVLTGNQDYTVFNGRESDPVGAVTATDLEVIKGQGFDTNKHSLVKIKKETSLAVALSA